MLDHRTRRELQALSREELIELALCQQAEIGELQRTLCRLANHGIEPPGPQSHSHESEPGGVTQQELEQATRYALRHLDDPLYLGQSALCAVAARVCGAELSGTQLQHVLYRAIDTVKPSRTHACRSRQQLRHAILRLAYLERRKATDAARLLVISERQYYREMKMAIHMVAEAVLNEFDVEAAPINDLLAGGQCGTRPLETISGGRAIA